MKDMKMYTVGKPLRLLTWNIRYDWMATPISGQKVPRHALYKDIDSSKETPWLKRGSKLIAGLQFHAQDNRSTRGTTWSTRRY